MAQRSQFDSQIQRNARLRHTWPSLYNSSSSVFTARASGMWHSTVTGRRGSSGDLSQVRASAKRISPHGHNLTDSESCYAQVPDVMAALFPCCRELHCCPDQQHTGAASGHRPGWHHTKYFTKSTHMRTGSGSHGHTPLHTQLNWTHLFRRKRFDESRFRSQAIAAPWGSASLPRAQHQPSRSPSPLRCVQLCGVWLIGTWHSRTGVS